MLKNELGGGSEQNQLLVPAAVSAHKSALFFILKQDKSMNLINGFDLLWKHTGEKSPYAHLAQML